MNREVHVRICGGRRVKLPPPTRRPAARCPTGPGRARRGRSHPVRRGHDGRPRRQGAVMTPAAGDGAAATTMSPPTLSPPTMSEAERYQRLRSHLAFLRLPTATEALPE